MRTLTEERQLLKELREARRVEWRPGYLAALNAAIRYCRQRIASMEVQ